MDEQLRPLLDHLQELIARAQSDDVIDDDERAALRDVISQIESALTEPDDRDGLVAHLEAAAIRFEGDHPTMAAVIRSAVDTLTGYGM